MIFSPHRFCEANFFLYVLLSILLGLQPANPSIDTSRASCLYCGQTKTVPDDSYLSSQGCSLAIFTVPLGIFNQETRSGCSQCKPQSAPSKSRWHKKGQQMSTHGNLALRGGNAAALQGRAKDTLADQKVMLLPRRLSREDEKNIRLVEKVTPWLCHLRAYAP